MIESRFRFDYSWEDARPIRPLVVTIAVSQIFGAVIGLLLAPVTDWIMNIIIGGGLSTFIGFIIGLIIQYKCNSSNLRNNAIMVRRLGLIALLMCAIALVFLFTNHRL